MMVRKYVVTGALLGLVIWLERRGRAETNPKASLSSYVTKNGSCYRVDLYPDGSSTSSPAPQSRCAQDADGNELEDTAPDPDLGFASLFNLFNDL